MARCLSANDSERDWGGALVGGFTSLMQSGCTVLVMRRPNCVLLASISGSAPKYCDFIIVFFDTHTLSQYADVKQIVPV